VSSILDALEKLERSRPPTPEGSRPTPAEPRRRKTAVLAGAAFAVGAAAAVTLFLLPAARAPVAEQPVAAPIAHTRERAEADKPPTAIEPAAAPAPVAVEPATPGAPEAPPATVAPPAATPPVDAAPATAPAPAGSPAERPALAAAPPVPPPAASDPRPWVQSVAPPPPPPAAPATRLANASPPRSTPAAVAASDPEPPPIRRAPAGAPHVQLSFLLFSPSAERRSVALAIDGGSLQTLHEGESTGGLQVVRILPDRVDVRWEGDAFTVRARD
jgi:hypothetical protein